MSQQRFEGGTIEIQEGPSWLRGEIVAADDQPGELHLRVSHLAEFVVSPDGEEAGWRPIGGPHEETEFRIPVGTRLLIEADQHIKLTDTKHGRTFVLRDAKTVAAG